MKRALLLAAVAGATAMPTLINAQSFQGLGFLPGGAHSFASSVNADGSVVVGYAAVPGNLHALPNGVPVLLLYQTTDPVTNKPVGTPNTRTNIAPGKAQTFYFAITPTQVMSQDIALAFVCTNTKPAPVVWGLNTFLLTGTVMPSTDMLSISDTLTHDGNMVISGTSGTGIMAVASMNIGNGGMVTFMPNDSPFGRPPRFLPLGFAICQTNSSGKCINPATPGQASTVAVPAGQTVFFTVFVQGLGTAIPYDPGNNRIFIIATQEGIPVGEASAAVKMQ